MGDTVDLKVAMAHRQAEAGLGRARLDAEARRLLNVETGDSIEIIGKSATVAKVFRGLPDDEGKGILRIDGLTRTNAGVSVDETVKVRRIDPRPAEKVVLAPNIPAGKKVRFGEGADQLFLKGLVNRPVLRGSDIVVPNIALMGGKSPFTVINTVPSGPVLIIPDTELVLREDPAEERTGVAWMTTYDDVGGLDGELKRVREMIELPLKHPHLFDRLGISPPKGVLLYGPPGTGKTLIAKALANESGAGFYSIQGPEIMSRYYGESEERLRQVFQQAEEGGPSILFIDEIDSIAPNRESVHGEVERRVVAQLLTLMDGLGDRGDVVVIGATNMEAAIDPALRRPGRFDREIEVGVPSRRGRRDILAIHTRGMPLWDDVDLEELVAATLGFVGADLAALCREAAMACLSRHMPRLDLDESLPAQTVEEMAVAMEDFRQALSEVEPSGMRELMVEVPRVSWDMVGGLDELRHELMEFFVPAEEPKAFQRLGIRAAKGMLLYGPPGTGKTLIAKALANESGANFISISGPEFVSKWVGESERALRHVFKRAKQMAPCIVFFDEIDSISQVRGGEERSGERIINQLLISLDGLEPLRNVAVVAATNRPDIIDPALLRPGRFDKLVLVPAPGREGRRSILEVHCAQMPLGDDVDLAAVASMTDGFVGADLENLCREAGLAAYREDPAADTVAQKHFLAAANELAPSADPRTVDRYERMAKDLRRRKAAWGDSPQYQ